MNSAGIAQREHPGPQDHPGSTPGARSTLAQAFAAALHIDPRSRALGRHDGARGLPKAPPAGCDAFSYFVGHRDGEMFGPGQ